MSAPAGAVLGALPLGTRVVVRYRIEGGFTDALGQLTDLGAVMCTVLTRGGAVIVALDRIVAAKAVPPPQARRRPRRRQTG